MPIWEGPPSQNGSRPNPKGELSRERVDAGGASAALAPELALHLRRVRRMHGGIAVEVRFAATTLRVLLVERFLELALHLLGGDCLVFAHVGQPSRSVRARRLRRHC